jgi:type III secretory pathway component EscU
MRTDKPHSYSCAEALASNCYNSIALTLVPVAAVAVVAAVGGIVAVGITIVVDAAVVLGV